MREMVFKNLTSVNSRKKDITLKEMFERNGVMAKTERRCFYFIKDITHLQTYEDVQKWLNCKNDIAIAGKRNFYIYKEHNDDVCEDKVMCKIAGTFYAVINKDVYTIAFLHSFKVRFFKASVI